eukprot:CCRYP_018562-RF/>CCRYP_018562-RF protein AED:0.47 eAED:1.00 QI:0/-1/0/1/-1/0/1/0/114
MAPCYKTYILHPRSGRLWGQICGPRACRPPHQRVKRKLHNVHRLGRKTLLWHPTRLGLRSSHFGHLHASIHRQCPSTFPTSHPFLTTKRSLQAFSKEIWDGSPRTFTKRCIWAT